MLEGVAERPGRNLSQEQAGIPEEGDPDEVGPELIPVGEDRFKPNGAVACSRDGGEPSAEAQA